jgi:hypothetical protein
MTDKLTVRITDWRPLLKNTLRGMAAVQIVEMRMTIRDVAVHQKGSATWAQPPSKSWVKDGRHVLDEATGKGRYTPIIEFSSLKVRDAFSNAVVAALRELAPHALGEPETAS